MKRKIIINLDKNYIYLGKESDMLDGFTMIKQVEKNCVLDYNENVLYNINGDFIVYDKMKNIIKKMLLIIFIILFLMN